MKKSMRKFPFGDPSGPFLWTTSASPKLVFRQRWHWRGGAENKASPRCQGPRDKAILELDSKIRAPSTCMLGKREARASLLIYVHVAKRLFCGFVSVSTERGSYSFKAGRCRVFRIALRRRRSSLTILRSRASPSPEARLWCFGTMMSSLRP